MFVRVLAALLLATGVSADTPTYASKIAGQMCALIGAGSDNYPGYFKGTAATDAVCKQYCDLTPQCGGYSHVPAGTLCYLFGNIADATFRGQKDNLGSAATEVANTIGILDVEIQILMTRTAGTATTGATCHVKKVDGMADSGHRATPTAVAAAVVSGAAAALCV